MAAHPKPHILLIILDTVRRDHLSTYGYQRATTPELDAFAADATVFRRAVSPAQWTVPVHASLFTGAYPTTHQLTQGDGLLSLALPTAAEILQVDGYHTVAFCNNPLVSVLNHGLQRGFDRFFNYASVIPIRPTDDLQPAWQRAMMKQLRPHMRRIGNQFAQSEEWFRRSLATWFVPIWTRAIRFKGDTALSLSDAMNYWDAHTANDERPLFMFVNLMNAHLPYRPPASALKRVAPELARDRAAQKFMRAFNADAGAWASPPPEPIPDWQTDILDAYYDAEIADQDAELGRLLRHLRERGQLERTQVIIAADHGEIHGEHDLFGHGFSVYQELVHVPLIVRDPDHLPTGGQMSEAVSTRRIFHTMLDAAGVTPPLAADDPNADVAGWSLRRSAGGGSHERDLAFSEAFAPLPFLHIIRHRHADLIDKLDLPLTRRAIYSGDHKLITLGERVEGLFDINADPTEQHDLTAQNPELVAALHATLRAFVQDAQSRQVDAALQGRPIDAAVMEQLRALGYID